MFIALDWRCLTVSLAMPQAVLLSVCIGGALTRFRQEWNQSHHHAIPSNHFLDDSKDLNK